MRKNQRQKDEVKVKRHTNNGKRRRKTRKKKYEKKDKNEGEEEEEKEDQGGDSEVGAVRRGGVGVGTVGDPELKLGKSLK